MKAQNPFDEKAAQWSSTRDLPWNLLRYELTHELIERHISNKISSVLEVGCGNGYESSLWNGKADYITLSDSSGKMLDSAKVLFNSLSVSSRLDFIQSDAKDLAEKTNRKFELILFNNVIEYVDDPKRTLASLKDLLAPNGMLAVRHINRYSNVFIPAMYEHDLETSLRYLQNPEITTSFGIVIKTYAKAEMQYLIEEVGYKIKKYYGLMTLTGYITDNERKYDPVFYKQLKEIELEMAVTFPYYDIARFGLFLLTE